MANKKKKRSKGAAPADATYTSTARPEERSAAPYEIYTADVNNHGSESSAAAHSLSKMDLATPTEEFDSWEEQEHIIQSPKAVKNALQVPGSSAIDLFDRFRDLDSTSEWASCYEPYGNTGERPSFNVAYDRAGCGSSTIKKFSSKATQGISQTMNSVIGKVCEAAVDGTDAKN